MPDFQGSAGLPTPGISVGGGSVPPSTPPSTPPSNFGLPGFFTGNRNNQPTLPNTIVTPAILPNSSNPACRPIYNNQAVLNALNSILASPQTLAQKGVVVNSAFIESVQQKLSEQIRIAVVIGNTCQTNPVAPPQSAKRDACLAEAGRIYDETYDAALKAGIDDVTITDAIGNRTQAINDACKNVKAIIGTTKNTTLPTTQQVSKQQCIDTYNAAIDRGVVDYNNGRITIDDFRKLQDVAQQNYSNCTLNAKAIVSPGTISPPKTQSALKAVETDLCKGKECPVGMSCDPGSGACIFNSATGGVYLNIPPFAAAEGVPCPPDWINDQTGCHPPIKDTNGNVIPISTNGCTPIYDNQQLIESLTTTLKNVIAKSTIVGQNCIAAQTEQKPLVKTVIKEPDGTITIIYAPAK